MQVILQYLYYVIRRRPLLKIILERAGMPVQVLGPYYNYIQQLKVRSTIAGGFGEEYAKPIGIPQGDPFSMMCTIRFCKIELREAFYQDFFKDVPRVSKVKVF